MIPEERLKNWVVHESQRGVFAHALYKQMVTDERIWILTGDLGFGVLDNHREDFPDRFVNCGASEQAMMGIAVGLALEGKIPFVYTITSFFLRAAETISLYLDGEQIPVKLVGSGRDGDYDKDGPSHHAGKAQDFLGRLKISTFYPENKEDIPAMVEEMVKNSKPSFISLRR